MHRRIKICLAVLFAALFLASAIIAEPLYKSKEDYLNKIPSRMPLDRDAQIKLPATKGALSIAGEPDIDAAWAGPSQWMTGVNWGGETFGGSIGLGRNFFGSSLSSEDYVKIRIIFQTGVPNQTLCQTFRRDLFYASGGVGTFPGSAWDISNPGTPRRLNMCFVEDAGSGTVNLTWDPSGSGNGKREYIYVMLSDYDGTGLTYVGANGNSGASSLDILYNWWPFVAAGHTFFENQPCTLTISTYYVKNLQGVPDSGQITLGWNYTGADTVDHFNIYGDIFSPPTTLIDQVASPGGRHTVTGLTNGQTYYFRIEADDAARGIVAASKEITAIPQTVSQGVTLLDFWHGYGTYGDCWGYVDSSDNNKEYALICARNDGVAIVDINVSPPVQVGFLPAIVAGNDSKDVKIYKNYAIVISENEPGQIFDISDVTNPVKVSEILNITSDGSNGAHNCMVDGDYLYVIGNHDIGGLEIFDISNPASPNSVGLFQPFYYHDVDIYGDTLVAAGIYGDGIDLLDISNKAAPAFIQRFNYSGSGAHNCEFIQGMDYVAIGDEIGTSPHTRIFDLQNLGAINKVSDVLLQPGQPVHNCYTRNDTLFIAHYALGMRMIDVSDPTNPSEVGYYDTYALPGSGFLGAWNVYPYFPSGKIIVSDMQTGLYVLQVGSGPPPGCCIGNRGDVNNDGNDANILDLNFLVNRIFRFGPDPVCPEEADTNSDGNSANILDLNYLVNRIFRFGPDPGPC